MRASTNISRKERKVLTISNFRGVDYSSSPLDVASNRATGMRNLINEFGVTKKRPGWNELCRIEGGEIGLFFEYVDGDRREIIVQAGAGFHRIPYKDGKYLYDKIEKITIDTDRKLNENRSEAFMRGGKAYIIGCGDYLVYGKDKNGVHTMRSVFDAPDTYVPTTTISISSDDDETDDSAMLDDVNMLSSWRINQMLGAEEGKTWTVDTGYIDADSTVYVTIETIEPTEEGDKPLTYKLVADGSSLHREGEVEEVGSIDRQKGKITLSISSKPLSSGMDNIFVKFRCTNSENAERIRNCRFGTTFGIDGNQDRLFLSGNPEYPNIDFHTEEDDFTYFGSSNTAAMGSDTVAIAGYGRLSDSTLMIYKEDGMQEPSVYYRTGRYDTRYDDAGNVVYMRGIFPLTAGSIGEGIISGRACANLGGDPLVLTRSGVYAVTLPSNVTTSERYMRERSRSIKALIAKHTVEELKRAVCTVWRNRYYLCVADECYIADTGYRYAAADDPDGSFNYEWWRWDNIAAASFAIIGGELHFGSKDGRICVFDGEYTDRTYTHIAKGDMSFNDVYNSNFSDIPVSSYIVCDNELCRTLKENDVITFPYLERSDSERKKVYALVTHSIKVKDGRIITDEQGLKTVWDGMMVYGNKDAGDLAAGVPHYVRDIDYGDFSYVLCNGLGKQLNLGDGGFDIFENISDRQLYITDVDVNSNSFKLKKTRNGNPLTLSQEEGEYTTDFVAKVSRFSNVVAEWYTPVFDLGTNMASKTLLGMTVSTGGENGGELKIGYETRYVTKEIEARGLNVFSLENFSFEEFSFDTGFATSFSSKCNVRNFNYIAFRFLSDSPSSCAVNNFSILYKINKNNKGVR